jgi:predicted nucleic acid-binding protein
MKENEYQPSSEAVLDLINASSCSAYDCEFVSLAKQFDCQLITQDKKILAEFPHHASQLKDYINKHR